MLTKPVFQANKSNCRQVIIADYIIIDGDTAQFLPSFGAATVVVQPGTIIGSGPATLDAIKICIEGDESSVYVSGCIYVTPQYTIPGTGTLKIESLASDQVATKTKTGGTPVILKGVNFNAIFEVLSPAQQPLPGTAPPIPDPTPKYLGQGMFITVNSKFQGT